MANEAFSLFPEKLPTPEEAVVHTMAAPPCIDDRTLMRYADRSLAPDESARVEQHLADCPDCTLLVRDFQAISAPIIRVHERGPVALAWLHIRRGGRLSSSLEEAWRLHRIGCASCAKKASVLEAIGVRVPATDATAVAEPRLQMAYSPSYRPTQRRRIGSFVTHAGVAGLAAALTLFITRFNLPVTHGDADTDPPIRHPDVPRVLPDLTASGILASMLGVPPSNPSREKSQIDAWKQLPPELTFEQQACLSGFYLRIGQRETNPQERKRWIEASKQSLLKTRAESDRRLKELQDLSAGEKEPEKKKL